MNAAKLYLAPGLRIHQLAEGHWQFVMLSSAFSIKCPEQLLRSVLQAEGKLSRDEWIASLRQEFDATALGGFIDSLLARGILCESASGPASAADAWLYALTNTRQNPHAPAFDAAAHPLYLHGTGVLRDKLASLAQDSGFVCTDDAARAAMFVLLADQPQHDDFRAANRDLVLAQEKPALFAWLDGAAARLLRVVPRATGCFECLHHRMRASKQFFREYDAASSGQALWHVQELPPPLLQAQHLATVTLMHAGAMLAGQVLDLHQNCLLECNVLQGTEKLAQVLKLPRCPHCGNGNANLPFAPAYDFKGM
ncbi:hypothetical protein V8J88_20950 [Massilia sp. W12]|uniref:hypothetical protein n=1 Tax=Massilia sp. W12 TaxID=3126507 RepID=UPI0030D4BC23